MNGRIRLRVWSVRQELWRTAYSTPELLDRNRRMLERYGYLVRVG
jgi:hypothetical protein